MVKRDTVNGPNLTNKCHLINGFDSLINLILVPRRIYHGTHNLAGLDFGLVNMSNCKLDMCMCMCYYGL